MSFRLIIISIALFFLSNCVIQTDKQPEADKIIQQLQSAIQQQDWKKAAALYSPDFFKTQSQATWQNTLKNAQQKLGEIESYSISAKSKDPRFSGDFYIYTVTVKHERGFSTETITLVRNIDSDTINIVGWQTKATRNTNE